MRPFGGVNRLAENFTKAVVIKGFEKFEKKKRKKRISGLQTLAYSRKQEAEN